MRVMPDRQRDRSLTRLWLQASFYYILCPLITERSQNIEPVKSQSVTVVLTPGTEALHRACYTGFCIVITSDLLRWLLAIIAPH